MIQTINVYINGTPKRNTPSKSSTSLANILHKLTIQSNEQSSICLNGCGINNWDPRDLITIFSFNLASQVDRLAEDIKTALLNTNDKIILNAYGFSRGGVGVFLLCQKLKNIDPSRLEINICALDPVPGNFIRATYADNISDFKSTLSAQVADLSECKNINKVLVLFTNYPFFDIICHGPILPIMPKHADITVDVIPGHHMAVDSFKLSEFGMISAGNNSSLISFHYVSKFLSDCGTSYNADSYYLYLESKLLCREYLTEALEIENQKVKNTHRPMHFYNKIESNEGQSYLNLLHKKLLTQEKSNDTSNCSLLVKDPSPQADYWNGLKSNGYFPLFAKGMLASTCVISALYCSPILGTMALATLGAYKVASNCRQRFDDFR